MRLPKFLLGIFVVTACALSYINQQTQILLTSYSWQKNQATYTYLLDRHEELLYNVTEGKSPQSLQEKLIAQRIDMQRPSPYQVVKIVKVETSPDTIVQRNERGFFGFLTPSAQAQARSSK